MEITEIFKDSLTYPTKDWNKLLVLGVLFLIPLIIGLLIAFVTGTGDYTAIAIMGIIVFVVTFITSLIISGYSLSITNKTILNSDEIPIFDWVKNLVDGIKVAVLSIIYYIIPAIITLIVAYATGLFEKYFEILRYSMYSSVQSNLTTAASTMPTTLINELFSSLMITGIIAIILFIIFGLLLTIATAKLAETGSLKAGLMINEVFDDIGKIGWGKYIIWIILLIIISIVISFLAGLISLIPIIGSIIVALVIYPYIAMFSARALGLIFNESKD